MINHPGSAILLLLSLSPFALADGSTDAVNERIPVNTAEMEAHWQVNCTAAWKRLFAAATQAANRGNCVIPEELRHEIQLCAFIYQVPGQSSQHECPDYSSASKYLQQASELTKCSHQLTSSLRKASCQASIQ